MEVLRAREIISRYLGRCKEKAHPSGLSCYRHTRIPSRYHTLPIGPLIMLNESNFRGLRLTLLPAGLLTAAGLIFSGCFGGAELENAKDHIAAAGSVNSGDNGASGGASGSGGGGNLGGGPGMMGAAGGGNQPAASCDALPIFEEKCGGCHNAAGTATYGVDLVSDGLAARLLDKSAVAPACMDSSALLVNSAQVQESLMLTKLKNTQACGSPMPVPYALKLNDEDMACVEKWIASVIAAGP